MSTAEPNLALWRDALAQASRATVFEDQASGSKAERPGRTEAVVRLRRGDALVVRKLDGHGRSMTRPIETVRRLAARNVGFRSLTQGIDIIPGGTLVFHLFGSLVQLERDLTCERTNAGLGAAQARSRKGARKPVVRLDRLAGARDPLAAGVVLPEAVGRVKVGATALHVPLAGSVMKPVASQRHPARSPARAGAR